MKKAQDVKEMQQTQKPTNLPIFFSKYIINTTLKNFKTQ